MTSLLVSSVETVKKTIGFFLMTFPSHSMTHMNWNAWWIYLLPRVFFPIRTFNNSSIKCNPSPKLCWPLKSKIKFCYLSKSRHQWHPHLWKGLTKCLPNARNGSEGSLEYNNSPQDMLYLIGSKFILKLK